ncbi:hypothetical protein MTR67_001866 [Solanum verrucosum]|uniref:Uncharacterized protein n=1 Tax=Solanum verrucosum TaxID=315347 RepID=A0AAF0T7V6_SOLVR|nr:hypothetical protein MTR67_001866 [Solanum verrucosum]
MLTKDKNDGSLLRELISIWLDEAITQHHIIKDNALALCGGPSLRQVIF